MSEVTRTIQVKALARVEGEGGIRLRIKDGVVQTVQFRIFEPPRFFEALLRGRLYTEAPDITSRICGICPIAYIMSASQAMEQALGLRITGPLRDLRRLVYCGEWIESHVLHAAMLHAPDFLGLPDAIALARENRALVEKALQLKKLGNQIIAGIGGRAVHPVNTRVGGFYRVPPKQTIAALVEPLQWGLEAARELLLAFAGFEFPHLSQDYLTVSLQHPAEYPITDGRIVSSDGLDIAVAEFAQHFDEAHVKHTTALQGYGKEVGMYLTGPLARYNNNFEQLSPLAREAAAEAGLGLRCNNPFQSILVRMVEVVYACEEALRLARGYEEPDAACVDQVAEAGEGHGATEAPRGLLYHWYRLDETGRILAARIVPPTSQNQRQIETDLLAVAEQNLALSEELLTRRCEQAVRNHDPCISCATHQLKVSVDRQ